MEDLTELLTLLQWFLVVSLQEHHLHTFLRLESQCWLAMDWEWDLGIICQPKQKNNSSKVSKEGNYGKFSTNSKIKRMKSLKSTSKKDTHSNKQTESQTCTLLTIKPSSTLWCYKSWVWLLMTALHFGEVL